MEMLRQPGITDNWEESVWSHCSPELTIYGMKQMLTPTMPSTSSFTCTYMMNGYISTVLTAICTRLEWYFPSFMYIHGFCFFIRKSYFEEFGLFDESNFMYGEEDDIRYRLRKKGFKKIIYNHQKHYIHLTRERAKFVLWIKINQCSN